MGQEDNITAEPAEYRFEDLYVRKADILNTTDGTLVKTIPFKAKIILGVHISHYDQLFLSLEVADKGCILSYRIVNEDFEPSTSQVDLDPGEEAVFEATGTLSVPGLRPLKCILGYKPLSN